jgi:hypothetical protein
MYDVDENDPSNPDHYKEAMIRGYACRGPNLADAMLISRH